MHAPTLGPGASGSAVRIDVGNLATDCTARQLSDLFARFGAIDHVEVFGNDKASRTSARALVVMADGADAAIAAMDGYRMNGRGLRVRRARGYSDLASLRAAIDEARHV